MSTSDPARVGAVEIADSVPAAVRSELLSHGSESARGLCMRLEMVADRLQLTAVVEPELGALCIDFVAGATGWRARGRAQHERLVRACAAHRPRQQRAPRIIDGTGGLGTDSWLLASAGASVIIIEQHPVVAALLADALRRARSDAPEVVARIGLRVGDTPGILALLERGRGAGARAAEFAWPQKAGVGEEGADVTVADVLYLDPMYPARRKRALGDRRLRLLAALLAADAVDGADASRLLQAGLGAPVQRVVLKCPRSVTVTASRPRNHELAGRSTRFDVWINPQRPPG